jgi:hypothetical protein
VLKKKYYINTSCTRLALQCHPTKFGDPRGMWDPHMTVLRFVQVGAGSSSRKILRMKQACLMQSGLQDENDRQWVMVDLIEWNMLKYFWINNSILFFRLVHTCINQILRHASRLHIAVLRWSMDFPNLIHTLLKIVPVLCKWFLQMQVTPETEHVGIQMAYLSKLLGHMATIHLQ